MTTRLFNRAAILVAVTLFAGVLTGAPVVAQGEPDGAPPESREEVVGRRTQSSKTFRNPDGTLTTRLFSGPVHYRGGDGRWKDIDSSLVAADEPGYALRNAANDFDVLFKEELRDGYVRVSAGGMDFDFSLTGAAQAAASRARGHGLRFGDAFPNVDLDYEVFDSGVKETLVLGNANVPTRYRFVMEASGAGDAHVSRTPEGAWAVFTSRSADPAMVFASPTVIEGAAVSEEEDEPPSTPAPSPHESPSPSGEASTPATPEPVETDGSAGASPAPPESARPGSTGSPSSPSAEPTTPPDKPAETPRPGTAAPSEGPPSEVDARQMQRAAALDVRELGRNRFEVVLELDPQWLHDPERRFPVLLDPTTLTVQPTADDLSYAWGCNSCVGLPDYRIYVGTGYQDVWRAALRFDTSALPVGTVSSAKLSLYHEGSCVANAPGCTTSSHSIEAYRMTKPWGPSTTVGTLEYQWPPIATYNLAAGATNVWMNWDATSTVQSWVDDASTNRGILLKRTVETLGANGAIAPLGHRHWDTYRRPKLEVTYTDLPVTLEVPETWHSNGAELSWTKFNSSVGGTFTGYEVHRSDNRDFRPSSDTLLTTISDVTTTRFVDTTAGSSRSYTYRIRTGSTSSNGQTGNTPADGMATKVLNGRWGWGDDTYLMYDKNYEVCDSYGQHNRMWVGSTSWSKLRSLLRFPVSDIPAGATVESAKLLLHQEGWLPSAGLKVNVHRATRDWSAGLAWNGCTWPGANWYKYDGVGRWGADGGDFDPAVEASVTTDGSTTPKWDNWDVTPLVRRWVRGEVPNFGMLLKAETEPLAGDLRITYDAAENFFGEHFNPRLEILYRDGSRSIGPSVAIASPGSGETVRGSTPVKVTATDDRKVAKVELLVDGAVVSSDTAAPYELTWSSTSVPNGSHSLTAKAYDDVGNTTTSAAVTVNVANSAPPTAQITAPSGGATVSGSLEVFATATDDTGVDKVEFYFDGYRFGEDLQATGTTFSASWNTLDPLLPAYNGTHQLTAVSVDKHGQRTESAPVTVTVTNAPGTKYKATYTTTALPQEIAFDPSPPANCGSTGNQVCPQQSHGVDLTATNTSGQTWLSTDVVARYRWYAADGTLAATGPNVSLGSNVAAGTSKQVRLLIPPPALPNGLDRAQYTLRLDLYDVPSAAYFTDKGNTPVDASVTVHRLKQTDQLGLERFYHYEGRELGAGMAHLLNLASGNSLVRWTPFASPGRGLSTVVDLTYNSLEDKSESPVGSNFSLSISGLTRFGNPLDVHPNKADEIAGNPKRYVRFIDGDGTTHEFTGKQATDGTIYWEEPAGVHLFLRTYSTTNPAKKWALTRPDRVTFFYDVDGYPTSVEDANGNKLVFGLESVPPGEDPGGPSKRIATVTDPAGADGVTGRRFTLDYYSKSEAKKPQIRGNVETITDHNGSALLFDYYEDGNLRRLTQKGGTKADGSFLPDRSFTFTYTTSSGSGAAITDPAARVNPDPRTSNQSTHLFGVRDPRGNETTFTYLGTGSGTARWKLASVKDRDGDTSTIQYDTATRKTTVTAPLSRVTTYGFDSEGKVTSILDPKGQTTALAWSADRHVSRVTEPSLEFTEYSYNANGYLTEVKDQLGNTTLLEYENLQVPGENGLADARDALLYWKSGRSIQHLSQLKKVTDPRGNFSTFTYDGKGNLKVAKDEAGFDTLFDYDPVNGNLTKVTDANNKATIFSRYDANGLPQEIKNAENETTEFSFDADGLLRWLQQPTQSASAETPFNTFYFDYDSFHRLGRQSAPQASDKVTWSGVDYDLNDNVVTELWGARGTPGTIAAAPGSRTSYTYDPMDRPTVVDGPKSPSTYPVDDVTKIVYDDAGRVTSLTAPRGVATAIADDFATFYTYDELDRTKRVSRHEVSPTGVKTETRNVHYCYSDRGDLASVTAPSAALETVACGSAAPGFTTTYTYDDAHRLKTITRPGSRVRSFGYDANGNVISVKNERLDETILEYDKRNMLETVREPFDGTRQIVTRYVYDPVGNLKTLVSPKAWDASPDTGANKTNFTDYVTEYVYDGANRVTTVKLPRRGAEQRHFVHHAYDDDGNLIKRSLPVDIAPNLDGSWPSAVPELLTTSTTYFRNGWLSSVNDGANPLTTYEYSPEGWQTDRRIGGTESERWEYHPDGLVKQHVDRAEQPVTYSYDANGNIERILDGSGKNGPASSLEMRLLYNGFDEIVEVKHQNEELPDDDTNWKFTTYAYDLNGNVKERVDDGTKANGVVTGRRHTFSYNDVDWLIAHRDWGKANTCADDQWIDSDYAANGWQELRIVKRAGASCTLSPDQPSWNIKQGTKWTYAKNGKLLQLLTKNGDPRLSTGTTIESHTVSYLESIDGKSLYLNGHRTKDEFTLSKIGQPCAGSTCRLTFTYDARDRLTRQVRTVVNTNAARETQWVLDPAGNVLQETGPPPTATQDNAPPQTRTFTYDGTRLRTVSVGGVVSRYLYDGRGNLDCVVKNAYPGTGCPASGNDLLTDYQYDDFNRLRIYRSLGGDGSVDDSTTYSYDVLDRVTSQEETHPGFQRNIGFTYVGLTDNVASEVHDDPTTATATARDVTKSYGYDPFGLRMSLTNAPAVPNSPGVGKAGTFTYAYDVHGSVSALIDEGGNVEASYGYDAYGTSDPVVSVGDKDPLLQLNAYRYTGKRTDTGSGTIDMGARRFSPDATRFLQPDVYGGALANLGLSSDPLTGNRYGLAAGNPVSFVEVDGHKLADVGPANDPPDGPPVRDKRLADAGPGAGSVNPAVWGKGLQEAEAVLGNRLSSHCYNHPDTVRAGKGLTHQCLEPVLSLTRVNQLFVEATGVPYTPGWEPMTETEEMIVTEAGSSFIPVARGARVAKAILTKVPGVERLGNWIASKAASYTAKRMRVSPNAIPVVGRQADTAAYKSQPGYQILDVPNWRYNQAVNDAWIKSIIDQRLPVMVASPMTPENLGNAARGIETMFGREIRQLTQEGGYEQIGDYLMPPV